MSALAPRRPDYAQLAEDLACHGGYDRAGVLAAHNLTEEQYLEIQSAPQFIAEQGRVKELLTSDKHAGVRLAARTALMMHVGTLSDIAGDSEAPSGDRVKAVSLLATLSDAMPKIEKAAAAVGPTLVVNIGKQSTPITLEAIQ